jgi:hypothetical protein
MPQSRHKETQHVSNNQKVVIDGERKAVLERVSTTHFAYRGLERDSVWSGRKAQTGITLVTQRKLNSACLHVQECEGQYPQLGQLIPVELIGKSGFRTGRAMRAHLTTIKDARSEINAKAKKFDAIKAQVQ